MLSAMEAVLSHLSKVPAPLLTSSENWQIVLHGGKARDVVPKVKRTRKLLPIEKQRLQSS